MRGIVTIALWASNFFFWGTLLLLTILLRLIPGSRLVVKAMLQRIVEKWALGHALITDVMVRIEWDIEGLEGLSPEGNYLIIANHRSWLDIPILERFLIGRVSFIRFFAKRELIFMPIVGVALWALEMPLVRRHPRELVEQRPELRSQDLETTRRACRDFARAQPESLLSFMEGTRFTPSKRAARGSPYRHLLKPKLGGVTLVLAAVGDRLRSIVDVTIIYPEGRGPVLWRFANGQMRSVKLKIVERPIPETFRGADLLENEARRTEFRNWIHAIWREKDELLEAESEIET